MKISKIRENARQALTGKWGKGAAITLAYCAIAFVITLIEAIFKNNSTMSILLKIVYIIFEVPITFGLIYAFIKLKRGEDVKAFDFLDMGVSNFGRSWKITLVTVLKLIIPTIGMTLGLVFISGSAALVVFLKNMSDSGECFWGLLIIGFILFILSFIWFLVLELSYSLTEFIAYDNPDMKASEVVKESANMMKGNRVKLLLLNLSFIGWSILAAFTLGIGYIWLEPYIVVATVCFYEYLVRKNQTNDDSNNIENNDDTIKEL